MLADLAWLIPARYTGQAHGSRNITTLENCPPDFLILGNLARQSFSADAYALGLCVLHLLVGAMPYEELMQAVKCPDDLADEWSRIWMEDDQYLPLRRVVKYDSGGVLQDTLYRTFVLFGMPENFAQGNPILRATERHMKKGRGRRKGKRKGRRAKDIYKTIVAPIAMKLFAHPQRPACSDY